MVKQCRCADQAQQKTSQTHALETAWYISFMNVFQRWAAAKAYQSLPLTLSQSYIKENSDIVHYKCDPDIL